MEPEWFASDEHLCAVVGSSVVGNKLRACITGGSTTASMTWMDFHYYSVQRGMQQIDALMHFRIANLSYAKYGTPRHAGTVWRRSAQQHAHDWRNGCREACRTLSAIEEAHRQSMRM